MFTTIEQVKALTGYTVDNNTVTMAQSIIEAFVGKVEAEVIDANDEMLLGKATAYQAAYMNENGNAIFEQAAVTQIGQFGQLVSYRQEMLAPFIAPLAYIACQRLSWKRIRSVKTGSIFNNGPSRDEWRYE